MAILRGNAEAAISMAVHVAGLLAAGGGPALRERDLDRQRPHPGDAARPGRGAAGSPPGRGGHRARRQHERPRAARRRAEGRHRARAALARERGRDPPQAGPDHRPLAGRAQGAPRLSRGRVAAWACLALTLSAGAAGAPAQRGGAARARPERRPARARRCWSRPTSRCCRRTASPRTRSPSPSRAGCASTAAAREPLCGRARGSALGLSGVEPDRLRPLHRRRAGLRVWGGRGGAGVVRSMPTWGSRFGGATSASVVLTSQLLGAEQRRRAPRARRSARRVPSTATTVGRLVRRGIRRVRHRASLRRSCRSSSTSRRRSRPRPPGWSSRSAPSVAPARTSSAASGSGRCPATRSGGSRTTG